ncbi:MAG TPA: DUF6249 domain-containing protein [Caulobacteraceae bacterium]|nr:DUF6249 domain-containing protein [Caulobacteraceae bacterium]
MWFHELTDTIAATVPPVAFFLFLAAIIIAPSYFRSRDRARLQETLRTAYEKGQPVPPELITALQTPAAATAVPTAERDLRRAVVLIAVGLGLVGLGYGLWYGLMTVSDVAAYITGGVVAGTGAIPGLIGLAYLILWLTKRATPRA